MGADAAAQTVIEIAKSTTRTAADYQAALEKLVADQKRADETSAACHARLFETSGVYKSLYRGSVHAPPALFTIDGELPRERPVLKQTGAEEDLELITESVRKSGESHAQAYARAIDSPEGRLLYAEIVTGAALTVGQD